MHLFRHLHQRLARSERGSISIETLIILPILVWALLATVVFFDGFRTRNQTQLAAQVVADLLTRESGMFTKERLEGMNDIFDFIADVRVPTRLRISSVSWASAEQRNVLQWSYGTRGLAPLPFETFEDLQNNDHARLVGRFASAAGAGFMTGANQAPATWLADRIPPAMPGEALIMVESFAIWSPFANVGIGQMRFSPVIVARPRFSPFIHLEGAVPVFPEDVYEAGYVGDLPPPPEQLPAPVPTAPPAQAQNVVVNDDFATSATGWSHTDRRATTVPGIGSFLGPFGGNTWDNPVTRTVNLGSASRSTARIAFDLLIIDSWDAYSTEWAAVEGDIFQILINGVPISSDPFWVETNRFTDNARTATVNHEGAVYSVNMTRTQSGTNFTGGGWNDQIWRVTVDIQAPPQTFTLGFRARLNEAVDNESFGIDNLQITWQDGPRMPAAFVANPATMTGTDLHTRFRTYSGCPQAAIATNWLTIRNSQIGSGIRFWRRAGGTQDLGTCGISGANRRISAQPTFVLNYINDGNGSNGQRLRIRTDDGDDGDDCDSTLLLRHPSGQFEFNNNLQNFGNNAGLNLNNLPSGQYTIWLGRHASGHCNTRVVIERY